MGTSNKSLRICIPGATSYTCHEPECCMSFDTEFLLAQHILLHQRKTLNCAFLGCKRKFVSAARYKTHLESHGSSTAAESNVENMNNLAALKMPCYAETSSDSSMLYFTKKVTRPYLCHYANCFKSFPTPYKLKIHIRSHTGEKPYICEVEKCSARFSSQVLLNRHSLIHSDCRPYKCAHDECNVSFRRLDALKDHARVHSKSKFVCSVNDCGSHFSSLKNLKIHMQRHTGIRPYQCTYENCDKSYLTSSNLKAHMKVHSKCSTRNPCFNTAKQLLSNLSSLNDHTSHSYALPEVLSPQQFLNADESSYSRDEATLVEQVLESTPRLEEVPSATEKSTYVDFSIYNDEYRLGTEALKNTEISNSCPPSHGEDTVLDVSADDLKQLSMCGNEFVDILNCGLDFNEITAVALGEVACVEYITSNLSESLALLEETGKVLHKEKFENVNQCFKDSSNNPQICKLFSGDQNSSQHFVSDVELVQLIEDATGSSEIVAGLNNVKNSGECCVEATIEACELDKSKNEIFCTETSMELSTGHLEIECGVPTPVATLPDHVYLLEGKDT